MWWCFGKKKPDNQFKSNSIDYRDSTINTLKHMVYSISFPNLCMGGDLKTHKPKKRVSSDFIYKFNFEGINKSMLKPKFRQVLNDHVRNVDVYKLINDNLSYKRLLVTYVLTEMGISVGELGKNEKTCLMKLLIDINLSEADEMMMLNSKISPEDILLNDKMDLLCLVGLCFDTYGNVVKDTINGSDALLCELLGSDREEEARNTIIRSLEQKRLIMNL